MLTVWTNGCFDILHRGHIELFRFGKESLEGELCVGLDTDERVALMKGKDRPKNGLEDRMQLVASIKYVDRVFSFGSDDELRHILKAVSPDYMIVGSDYKKEDVVGSEYTKEVVLFEKIKGYSSSNYLK
jgi:rfaE bifunctional protein nucleotidyltransferase chain/domain